MPKFSLIVPTRSRPQELVQLFNSLREQTFKDFEVVLIDQNGDQATLDVVNEFTRSGGVIIHLRPGPLPLSAARNVGLRKVTGEFIGFPDDDCHYPPGLLADVLREMEVGKLDILSCRGEEPLTGRPLLSSFPNKRTEFTLSNLLGIGMSITLFFRASCIQDLFFDEELGVGRPAGSGEESDFLFKAFHKGARGAYVIGPKVFHPYPLQRFDQLARERAYRYGLGYGIVMRRYWSLASVPSFLRGLVIRPIGGMVLSLFSPGRFLWCLATLKGRWKGFLLGV